MNDHSGFSADLYGFRLEGAVSPMMSTAPQVHSAPGTLTSPGGLVTQGRWSQGEAWLALTVWTWVFLVDPTYALRRREFGELKSWGKMEGPLA